MRVPVSIPMGGKRVRISYKASLPGGEYGLCVPATFRVTVSKAACESPEDVFSTVFHELKHIALYMTGQSENLKLGQEEGIVTGMEQMLAPLFMFNPAADIKWREIQFPWEEE
jgi:hypothetical protein